MTKPCFQVQTTVNDRGRADELVKRVVESRLAACGQVLGPIESTYWWQERVETEREWLCVFKTTAALAPRLESFLRDTHPYEVPEVVGFEMDLVASGYRDWIHDETDELE